MKYVYYMLTIVLFSHNIYGGDNTINWNNTYQGISAIDLISKSDKFNNRRVMVFGFFHFDADFAYLYNTDKECLGGGGGVEIKRSGLFYKKSGHEIYRDADIDFNGRWGSIKATFHGEGLLIEDDGEFVNDRVLTDIQSIDICEDCGALIGENCPNSDSRCCVHVAN